LTEGADFGLDNRWYFGGERIGAVEPALRLGVDQVVLDEQGAFWLVQPSDFHVAAGAAIRLSGAELALPFVVGGDLAPLIWEIGVLGEARVDLRGGQQRIGLARDERVQDCV